MTKALAADIVTEKANQLGDVNAANGAGGKNAANGAGARSTSSMKKSGAKNSKTLESTRRKGNDTRGDVINLDLEELFIKIGQLLASRLSRLTFIHA